MSVREPPVASEYVEIMNRRRIYNIHCGHMDELKPMIDTTPAIVCPRIQNKNQRREGEIKRIKQNDAQNMALVKRMHNSRRSAGNSARTTTRKTDWVEELNSMDYPDTYRNSYTQRPSESTQLMFESDKQNDLFNDDVIVEENSSRQNPRRKNIKTAGMIQRSHRASQEIKKPKQPGTSNSAYRRNKKIIDKLPEYDAMNIQQPEEQPQRKQNNTVNNREVQAKQAQPRKEYKQRDYEEDSYDEPQSHDSQYETPPPPPIHRHTYNNRHHHQPFIPIQYEKRTQPKQLELSSLHVEAEVLPREPEPKQRTSQRQQQMQKKQQRQQQQQDQPAVVKTRSLEQPQQQQQQAYPVQEPSPGKARFELNDKANGTPQSSPQKKVAFDPNASSKSFGLTSSRKLIPYGSISDVEEDSEEEDHESKPQIRMVTSYKKLQLANIDTDDDIVIPLIEQTDDYIPYNDEIGEEFNTIREMIKHELVTSKSSGKRRRDSNMLSIDTDKMLASLLEANVVITEEVEQEEKERRLSMSMSSGSLPGLPSSDGGAKAEDFYKNIPDEAKFKELFEVQAEEEENNEVEVQERSLPNEGNFSEDEKKSENDGMSLGNIIGDAIRNKSSDNDDNEKQDDTETFIQSSDNEAKENNDDDFEDQKKESSGNKNQSLINESEPSDFFDEQKNQESAHEEEKTLLGNLIQDTLQNNESEQEKIEENQEQEDEQEQHQEEHEEQQDDQAENQNEEKHEEDEQEEQQPLLGNLIKNTLENNESEHEENKEEEPIVQERSLPEDQEQKEEERDDEFDELVSKTVSETVKNSIDHLSSKVGDHSGVTSSIKSIDLIYTQPKVELQSQITSEIDEPERSQSRQGEESNSLFGNLIKNSLDNNDAQEKEEEQHQEEAQQNEEEKPLLGNLIKSTIANNSADEEEPKVQERSLNVDEENCDNIEQLSARTINNVVEKSFVLLEIRSVARNAIDDVVSKSMEEILVVPKIAEQTVNTLINDIIGNF